MSTQGEKFIFGFLGAITAIIFGLAVYHDYQKPIDRNPASEKEQINYSPYPYYFD